MIIIGIGFVIASIGPVISAVSNLGIFFIPLL